MKSRKEFTAHVIQGGRVTIPEPIRESLKIKEKDIVTVTITKETRTEY